MNECITSTIAAGFLGVLIGAVLGHRFAIGRDKRKEFNEIADKIIGRWSKQADEPSPYNVVVTDDFCLLRRHFSWWNKKAYDQAADEYYAAHEDSNQIELPGKMWAYKDPQRVSNAAKNVIRLLKRR